ncbi:MAG TPA: TIM barrel protein, partial [Bryobacteraceae bacterium]|nr:TIM barrel protein [Bryobacteraceae bacterium]
MTRRDLLATSAALPAAASVLSGASLSAAAEPGRRIRLAVSTYSYWHFTPRKFPIEKVIEEAAAIGFDGVEILHRQMENESPAYINRLKQLAFRNGLSLPMLSIHQNFVSPDAAVRKENIDHTIRAIGLAAQLGIPAIRINSGR